MRGTLPSAAWQVVNRVRDQGFSLVELLLACSLGLLMVVVVVGWLLQEQILGSRLGVVLRQRQLMMRANQLISADIQRGVALAPELLPSCSMAGRQPLLQILLADGAVISYSIGPSPSRIWRGHVLMRCGPAYGLDGQLNPMASYQHRVVLDGLDADAPAWQGCALPHGQREEMLASCWEQVSGLVQWQLSWRQGELSLQQEGQAVLQAVEIAE